MSDELTRLQAELEQIEQALATPDALPAAQRETILSALRGQRDALQTQITALAGSGAGAAVAAISNRAQHGNSAKLRKAAFGSILIL